MGEVFDRYTDTVGNYHFTDTETGHHVVSNESAIKELKWMLTDNSNTGDMYDALKMAIEALESLPNTLNTLECVELDKNSTKVDNENVDLISRQDAIDIIDMDKMKPEIAPSLGSTAERDFKIYNQSCNKHIELIKQLPSAQPEIIRCKDCKWHLTYNDEKYNVGYELCSNPMMMSGDSMIDMSNNDFCSHAERRTDG